MKIRRVIISAVLAGFAIFGSAAPANAGLWCEQTERIDEIVEPGGAGSAAGDACRAVLGVACSVVNKLNGGSGCLA